MSDLNENVEFETESEFEAEPESKFFFQERHNYLKSLLIEKIDKSEYISSEYSVRLGDGLMSIALKHYNDASLWLAIAIINQLSLDTNEKGHPTEKLSRGQKLKLPNKEEIEQYQKDPLSLALAKFVRTDEGLTLPASEPCSKCKNMILVSASVCSYCTFNIERIEIPERIEEFKNSSNIDPRLNSGIESELEMIDILNTSTETLENSIINLDHSIVIDTDTTVLDEDTAIIDANTAEITVNTDTSTDTAELIFELAETAEAVTNPEKEPKLEEEKEPKLQEEREEEQQQLATKIFQTLDSFPSQSEISANRADSETEILHNFDEELFLPLDFTPTEDNSSFDTVNIETLEAGENKKIKKEAIPYPEPLLEPKYLNEEQTIRIIESGSLDLPPPMLLISLEELIEEDWLTIAEYKIVPGASIFRQYQMNGSCRTMRKNIPARKLHEIARQEFEESFEKFQRIFESE